MSDSGPLNRFGGDDSVPASLADLSRLVRHLGDELSGYRKRAMSAEARLKALDEMAAQTGADPKRLFELEQANSILQTRLEAARARTKAMLERVRFLRQQHGQGSATS